MGGQATRRGGWPGPRKPQWSFRPTDEARAAVNAYLAERDLDPEDRGARSTAINAILAARATATPALTEETQP